MEIQTNRLVLKSCTPKEYKLFSMQYKMGPHIERYLKELQGNPELEGWGVWLAFRKDTGTPIGDLGFKGQANADGFVEIGYGILPEEQNCGFATEAAAGLIDWAVSTGLVKKVLAECATSNGGSIKVLQKLGMQKTASVQGLIYWELSN